MAQTYSEFVAYVTTYLWRDNDVDLANNIDVLIQQANDELDTMTRDWQRRQKTTRIQPESEDFDLATNVSDYGSIISLTNNESGFYRSKGPRFHNTLPQEIYEMRTRQQNNPYVQPYYAVDRDDGTLYLRLVGPYSAENPGDLQMQYTIAIPDYASADASWMEDEYLNLYLYTVLKHCAMFLREDERVQVYKGMQDEAFDKADRDDKHNLQHGGTPLRMRPHRKVP